MLIRDQTSFVFASTPSSTFNIVNINISSGMQEEPFVAEKTIIQTKVRGRTSPYFSKIIYEPLEFQVSFAFEDTWDDTEIKNVVNWLCGQTYYQPLYFGSQTDTIYYAIVVESPTLVHNCLSQGYVQLTFRCNSPYAYSSLKQSTYNFTTATTISDDLSTGTLTDVEII